VAERLMSRREVAEYLDVPEATLARWAYVGGGPSYFRVGRHTRYRFEDVIAWLEKNRSPDARATG
jgi:excisionase family DNA binding protein